MKSVTPDRGRARFASLAPVAVTVACLLAVTATHASPRPSLTRQFARSQLVLVVTVDSVTAYDEGRITVSQLKVDRVLKGEPGNSVLVVQRHDMPASPDLLPSGDQAIVFLIPASRPSSFRQALPQGKYYEALGGRSGVLSSRVPAELEEASAILVRTANAIRTPLPEPERVANARGLVFDQIAARHPIIVAEGVNQLAALAGLSTTLTGGEQRRLEQALGRTDLPEWVRVALVDAIAATQLEALIPALRTVAEASADLQRAAWRALTKLGHPPTAADLKTALASPIASQRAAALQTLVTTDATVALDTASDAALRDPDLQVRRQAVEALGSLRSAQALPTLEQVFTQPNIELRQAAVRSILAIGGAPATESLGRLAFEGPADSQKFAVLALMMSSVPPDDPLMQRIRNTHPDDEIRDLVAHGIEVHDH